MSRPSHVPAATPRSLVGALAPISSVIPRSGTNAIVAFLVINPLLFAISPTSRAGCSCSSSSSRSRWRCAATRLQPGGLLAIEAVVIGMTSPAAVYEETLTPCDVLLLLIFMVAGHLLPARAAAVHVHEALAQRALEDLCSR